LGSTRHADDDLLVEELKKEVKKLGLQKNVIFQVV